MNRELLASLLNGNGYGNEYSKDQAEIAKENGLVIVHGYSDDNIEFAGAISDEYGCYNGGEVRVTKKLNIKEANPGKGNKNVISAIWCPKDHNGKIKASWSYQTEIPHSVFEILEDENDVYCYGIIFNIKDLE